MNFVLRNPFLRRHIPGAPFGLYLLCLVSKSVRLVTLTSLATALSLGVVVAFVLSEFEIVRYGIVGVLAMVAYYAAYTLGTLWKRERYIIWATLAFVAYMIVSFPLHKFWTFRTLEEHAAELQLTIFTLQRALFQVLNNVALRTAVARLKPPFVPKVWMTPEDFLHPIPAQIIVHIVMFFPSYLITEKIFSFF